MQLDQGFVQIYTGNGKGKTTAAIGQAIRAIGSGLRVYFAQFMKDYAYGEVTVLERLAPELVLKRYGNDEFVFQKKEPESGLIDEVNGGFDQALQAMLSGKYDVVVLDEVLVSIYFRLFSTEQVIRFIKQKPDFVELILTGRYCPPELENLADLVTNMTEVKHYYQQGVMARRGIES